MASKWWIFLFATVCHFFFINLKKIAKHCFEGFILKLAFSGNSIWSITKNDCESNCILLTTNCLTIYWFPLKSFFSTKIFCKRKIVWKLITKLGESRNLSFSNVSINWNEKIFWVRLSKGQAFWEEISQKVLSQSTNALENGVREYFYTFSSFNSIWSSF